MSSPDFIDGQEGIYFDLPAEQYHQAPGVSKSTLWAFYEASTPKHFQARKPKAPTDDMEFGTVCHTHILEPERAVDSFHLQPSQYPETDKKGVPTGNMKKWNGNATYCREWKESRLAGFPIIDQGELDRVHKIVESVRKLPHFGPALENGKREVSFFKRDEETGLMLKCRADLVATAANGDTYLFDPKKVQSGGGSEKEFGDQVLNYGYHVQGWSYLAITGATGFVFVPFDDDEPFDCAEWPLSPELLELGQLEWRNLLHAYKTCLDSGNWPGYQAEVRKLPLPRWASKRLENARNATIDREHAAWRAEVK